MHFCPPPRKSSPTPIVGGEAAEASPEIRFLCTFSLSVPSFATAIIKKFCGASLSSLQRTTPPQDVTLLPGVKNFLATLMALRKSPPPAAIALPKKSPPPAAPLYYMKLLMQRLMPRGRLQRRRQKNFPYFASLANLELVKMLP